MVAFSHALILLQTADGQTSISALFEQTVSVYLNPWSNPFCRRMRSMRAGCYVHVRCYLHVADTDSPSLPNRREVLRCMNLCSSLGLIVGFRRLIPL